MDIGFIGLGQMGFHMARRLVEAGHRVTVFDTRREAMGRLTARGAEAVQSPRDVADRAETVMASLPTPDIVFEVATGRDGVIEPVLASIGKFFFIGERPGAGQTMKLCNNFLSAAAMTATSEAMVMAARPGLIHASFFASLISGPVATPATKASSRRLFLPRPSI